MTKLTVEIYRKKAIALAALKIVASAARSTDVVDEAEKAEVGIEVLEAILDTLPD